MEFRKMVITYGNEELDVYDKLSERWVKMTAVKFVGGLFLLIIGGCIDRDSEETFVDLNDLYDILGLDRVMALNGYFMRVEICNPEKLSEMFSFDDDGNVIFDPTPLLLRAI